MERTALVAAACRMLTDEDPESVNGNAVFVLTAELVGYLSTLVALALQNADVRGISRAPAETLPHELRRAGEAAFVAQRVAAFASRLSAFAIDLDDAMGDEATEESEAAE